MSNFSWNHSKDVAMKDCQTLLAWERGRITTKAAITQLAKQNRCPEMTEKEFLQAAANLGYHRERYSQPE